HFEHKGILGRIDGAGAEDIRHAQRLDPLLALADHFHKRHFTLDARPVGGEVRDFMHRHETVELRLDLLDHHGGAAGDDGDARQVGLLVDTGHRQPLNALSAHREQADHPRQHAELIIDKDGYGVAKYLVIFSHYPDTPLRVRAFCNPAFALNLQLFNETNAIRPVTARQW